MATVLDSIKRYQYIIDKHSQDEQKVLKCINKLYHLDVTVQHLQETGVGRTINSLRKESGDVGPAARSLVQKWKEMVAAEDSDEKGYQSHETTTYNGHGSGQDSDDNGHHDTRLNNTDASSKMNGSHSGIKREYHSSEDDDSNVKRSKYSYEDHGEESSKIKKVETDKSKREEHSKLSKKESEHDSHDSDGSDSGESDSSESSDEYSKSKTLVKKESSSNNKSSKHSSQENHHSEKRDSSSIKKSHKKEKHSEYHSSSSKERHSSEKSTSKEKSHRQNKESYHRQDKDTSHRHDKESSHRQDKESSHRQDRESSLRQDKERSHRHDKESSHRQDKESSYKHKSSVDKDIIPEKRHKSDHKSADSKISSKDSKSSSKTSKTDDHRTHRQDSSDKHKSSSEKHTSKSDKHRSSSQNADKEKHKPQEAEENKHKSKDSHSSSSKEKYSSSSKEKSKDKHNSSKDKSSSQSSHKQSGDSKSSSSENRSKSDKHESRSSEKKSKHKSSSSSEPKTEKSSSKTQENVPKKKDPENHEDSDDGIDCGSGASFAEALGMISPVKAKKKFPPTKEIQSPTSSFTNDLSPAALLAPTAKLAPLPALEITALPEISPNYRPRPPPKALSHFTDDEALNAGISSKNQRTKVYSGNKVMGKIPSLYEMCVHILQEHIDALEFTGGVPYNILKPIVDRATPQQLFTLEHFNPYLMEDTDHLWQKFCEKSFRNKPRHEMETWREMYLRCQQEQEHRLRALTANIKITQEAKKAPIKQTKMAYVDTVVKPPRNIARKQALHGTAHASTASPAARVASLASAPNVARAGAVRPAPVTLSAGSSANKPKKAPLMQKALQFMRGRKR